jgi:hypothetical protein
MGPFSLGDRAFDSDMIDLVIIIYLLSCGFKVGV